jgi:hypothetical protein
MNALSALLASLFVSLTLSTSLVGVMARPLRLILKQLCPATDAFVFWAVFTEVMLYLAPLITVLLAMSSAPEAAAVSVIRAALVAALLGAIGALLVVGYQVANARPPQTTGTAQRA